MARIGSNRSNSSGRQGLDSALEARRRAEEAAAPWEVRGATAPAEATERLRSAIAMRNPAVPSPQGGPDTDFRMDSEQPDPNLIDRLAAMDARKVAFDIALLSLRLRPHVEATGGPDALRGLDALDQQVRLYEHLHILRTETESPLA